MPDRPLTQPALHVEIKRQAERSKRSIGATHPSYTVNACEMKETTEKQRGRHVPGREMRLGTKTLRLPKAATNRTARHTESKFSAVREEIHAHIGVSVRRVQCPEVSRGALTVPDNQSHCRNGVHLSSCDVCFLVGAKHRLSLLLPPCNPARTTSTGHKLAINWANGHHSGAENGQKTTKGQPTRWPSGFCP